MKDDLPDGLPEGLRVSNDDDPDPLTASWGEEETPESEFFRARFRMRMRGAVFGTLAVVVTVSLMLTVSDLRYFLLIGQEPIDLGCLRTRRAEGQEVLEVPSNSYVALENQVMTYEAESDRYEYFFDPLYNIITRTRRSLPRKQLYRTVEVPEHLVWLIEDRKAFAEDLTAGFDGQGRLLRADQAPRRAKSLYRVYEDIIQLPTNEVYLFYEGEAPRDYLSYAIGYLVALAIILTTGMFFIRSYRVYRRSREIL